MQTNFNIFLESTSDSWLVFWDWVVCFWIGWYVLGLDARVVCFGTVCQDGMFWDWVPGWYALGLGYILGLGARVVCFGIGWYILGLGGRVVCFVFHFIMLSKYVNLLNYWHLKKRLNALLQRFMNLWFHATLTSYFKVSLNAIGFQTSLVIVWNFIIR